VLWGLQFQMFFLVDRWGPFDVHHGHIDRSVMRVEVSSLDTIRSSRSELNLFRHTLGDVWEVHTRPFRYPFREPERRSLKMTSKDLDDCCSIDSRSCLSKRGRSG